MMRLKCDRCDGVLPTIPMADDRPTVTDTLRLKTNNNMNEEPIHLCKYCRKAVYHFIFDYYMNEHKED